MNIPSVFNKLDETMKLCVMLQLIKDTLQSLSGWFQFSTYFYYHLTMLLAKLDTKTLLTHYYRKLKWKS